MRNRNTNTKRSSRSTCLDDGLDDAHERRVERVALRERDREAHARLFARVPRRVARQVRRQLAVRVHLHARSCSLCARSTCTRTILLVAALCACVSVTGMERTLLILMTQSNRLSPRSSAVKARWMRTTSDWNTSLSSFMRRSDADTAVTVFWPASKQLRKSKSRRKAQLLDENSMHTCTSRRGTETINAQYNFYKISTSRTSRVKHIS